MGKRRGLFVVVFHVSTFDRRRTSSVQSHTRFRTKIHCIWYHQFVTLRPLIRSSTTRMKSSPVLKSRSVAKTLFASRVSSVFKAGSNLVINCLRISALQNRPWRVIFIVPSRGEASFFLFLHWEFGSLTSTGVCTATRRLSTQSIAREGCTK